MNATRSDFSSLLCKDIYMLCARGQSCCLDIMEKGSISSKKEQQGKS